jgi:hypothetical protein
MAIIENISMTDTYMYGALVVLTKQLGLLRVGLLGAMKLHMFMYTYLLW